MTHSPTPASTDPAADPLSRAKEQLYQARNGPIRRAELELQELDRTRSDLVARLADVDARALFLAEKLATWNKSTVGNPGLVRRMDSRPYDDALLALAKRVKSGGWEKFRRHGADDQTILLTVKVGWGYSVRHGHHPRESVAYGDSNGGPRVELHGGHAFKGMELAAELRRVLEIPPPGANAKAAAGGGGGAKKDDAGEKPAGGEPTAAKPGRKPRRGRKAKATAAAADDGYGRWLAEVNAHSGLNLRPQTAPAAWRERFDQGVTPAAAAVSADKPGRGPSFLTPDAGETYPAVALGLAPAELEKRMASPHQHHPLTHLAGLVREPVTVAGQRYVVLGGRVETGKVTYRLHPAYTPGEWGQPGEGWEKRKGSARYKNRAPEDVQLEGLAVQTEAGEQLVLGPDAEVVYATGPHPASKANGAHPSPAGFPLALPPTPPTRRPEVLH